MVSLNPDRRVAEAVERLGPGNKAVKIDSGANFNVDIPGGPTKAIVCDIEGTINFIDWTGATCTAFPVQAGLNNVPLKRLTGFTGPTNIWALLDVRA